MSLTSEGLKPRAEVLNRLDSTSRRAESAAEVNTDAVRMLLALACAKGDRMKRNTLLKSGGCEDGVNGEAIRAMVEHGWVEAQGPYLVLTLAGNGVACAVVRLAREVGV